MGFRKALYDVEEKGLDPNKPHKKVGTDGRLKPKNKLEQSVVSNSFSSGSQECEIIEDENKQETTKQDTDKQVKQIKKRASASVQNKNKKKLSNALKDLPETESKPKKPTRQTRKRGATTNKKTSSTKTKTNSKVKKVERGDEGS